MQISSFFPVYKARLKITQPLPGELTLWAFEPISAFSLFSEHHQWATLGSLPVPALILRVPSPWRYYSDTALITLEHETMSVEAAIRCAWLDADGFAIAASFDASMLHGPDGLQAASLEFHLRQVVSVGNGVGGAKLRSCETFATIADLKKFVQSLCSETFGITLPPARCPYCGEPKVPGSQCVGCDECIYGADGTAAETCDGWGPYCCKCGADYARGQL